MRSLNFVNSIVKVARCRVHAENKRDRKTRTCMNDRDGEDGSEIVDDKIQMLCDRLSTTNCGRNERNLSHHKTSKVRKSTS